MAMDLRRPKANADCAEPVAESTHVEESTRSSSTSSKFVWGGKFNIRNNKSDPIDASSSNSSIQKPIDVRPKKKLDAQIYRDTQSYGLAARIVQYHETSEAKSRPIANQACRQPGDFPLVQLEKNEISHELKPRHISTPNIAKINVAPPISLTNTSAAARSTIFRTGKNYGDALLITSQSDSDTIEDESKQLEVALPSKDNKPIALTNDDYDSNLTLSIIDASKDISRKRIYCGVREESDGDYVKKQKPEQAINECPSNDLPSTSNVSKRTRDRASPIYTSGSSVETEKKRYKNNDILSSLSSSISMNTPKRTIDSLPEPIAGSSTVISDIEQELPKLDRPLTDESVVITPKPSIGIHSIEANASKSNNIYVTAPNQLQTATTSAVKSEKSPQKQLHQQTPKVPKLTLFNKEYNHITSENHVHHEEAEDDDNEENGIAFIQPKTRKSTIFSTANKNRTGAKSKLAIMLSCLSGGDSNNGADSIDSTSNRNTNRNDDEIKMTSESLNLSTTNSSTITTETLPRVDC